MQCILEIYSLHVSAGWNHEAVDAAQERVLQLHEGVPGQAVCFFQDTRDAGNDSQGAAFTHAAEHSLRVFVRVPSIRLRRTREHQLSLTLRRVQHDRMYVAGAVRREAYGKHSLHTRE